LSPHPGRSPLSRSVSLANPLADAGSGLLLSGSCAYAQSSGTVLQTIVASTDALCLIRKDASARVIEAALIPCISHAEKLAIRSIFSMLRLLIDTSAWLDLAMRRDGQKWIVPLRAFLHQGKLDLLVPPLVIEEFEHNRPRSEAAVTRSALARLRQLRRELHDFAGEKHEHVWLEETEQHIPLVNAMAPQNFREIAELLSKGTKLKPTNADRARVVQRGLEKKAPFSAGKNSVADALLIEMYATQLKKAGPDDVYCFVTSNHRDFSAPNGDHRQPHSDLADSFSSPQSRYLYQVEGLHAALLDYFGDEFAEEYEEVEFLIGEDEPRTLAEIVDAMEEFFDRKHSRPPSLISPSLEPLFPGYPLT
jgi:PIN domain